MARRADGAARDRRALVADARDARLSDPLTPGRRVALDTLLAVGRGRRLDLAFADALSRVGPSDEDRRFAHELAYGTVRFRGRLDHLLDHHLRQGISSVSPALLELLRMGSHQLLGMDGVPAYAAVSQAVDEARSIGGKGAAGLTNAVLRAVGRSGADPALFPDRKTDPAAWLSTWGSHPRWLVERWLTRWSVEEVTSLVEANNRPPPLTVTPLDRAPEAAVETLAEAGIEARVVGGGASSVEIVGGGSPERVLSALPCVVQDPAASLVAAFVDPPPGSTVADLCAAPGGKSLVVASRGATVVAADPSAPRLRLLKENVERVGARVLPVRGRAEAPCVRPLPVVLVDAPCTGTGTLRRHPDARWRLRPGDVGTMSDVQDGILHGAAKVVSSGGVLVYATCSIEEEENEDRVRAFLRRRPDFRSDDGADGFLQSFPWRSGFDGAFAARLRKRPG